MITKSIKERIKEYFFIHPTKKLRVRQIEREVNVPFPSAVRYTKELKKEGILKEIEISGIKLFAAARTRKEFLLEKKLFNIRQIHESGLIKHFIEEYSNPTIVLFGSYERAEDTEESDIDLYIETPKKEIKKLERFEKKLKRKIQIFSYKKIQDIKNKELANNIINGVKINGFIEVF